MAVLERDEVQDSDEREPSSEKEERSSLGRGALVLEGEGRRSLRGVT